MADVKKTVEIVFGGRDEVSQTIDNITGKFGNFSQMANTVVDPLAGVADSILKVDAALAALAIGGLALAIKSSGDFNAGFAFTTTLISETGAGIAAFKENVKDYAMGSTQSIESINAALYNAISGGVEWQKSIEFMTAAEKLSVAGKSQLADTTKILISTLNAYGASTKDVTDFSDIFFKSAQYGQMTLSELTAPLSQITGIAVSAKVPFADLAAAIAGLTSMGLPASQAITGLKAALSNVIKPSSEAEQTAASLGIQFDTTALASKGLAQFLWDTYKAAGGNIDTMGKLFGSVEGLNAVMMLGGDNAGKYAGALKALEERAGSTTVGYEKMVNEFEYMNQRLKNSFTITLATIGDELMPQYGQIAGAMADLLKGIKVGVDTGAFDPLFAYLNEVSGNLATWIKGVSAALPEALTKLDWSSLIRSFRELGEALGLYFGEMDLTKADDLAAALQMLIEMGAGLVRVTTGMVNAFRPFLQTMVDFLIVLSKSDDQTQETTGKILGFAKAIETLGYGVAASILFFDEYGLSIKGAFEIVGGSLQVLWNGFTILVDAIKGVLIMMGDAIITTLDSLTFRLIPGLATASEKLKEWGKNINFSQDAEDARKGLFTMMQGFADLGTETQASTSSFEKFRGEAAKIPTHVAMEVTTPGLDASVEATGNFVQKLKGVPEQVDVVVTVEADGTTVETTRDMIYKYFPPGSEQGESIFMTNIGTRAHEASLAATKNKIEEAIPKEKSVEIQARIDETRIKEASAVVQKSIEWEAKIDIAKIEAAATVIKTTFESINNTISSTGTTITSMMDSYVKTVSAGMGGGSFVEQQIVEEGRRRDKALKLQEDMTEVQVDLIKQQTESLKKGEAMIQIDGKGLQPHLEAFMFEILAAIQVKANAQGMKMLVGA